MAVDPVQAGIGFVDGPGLYPISTGYVLGNSSGVTAYPYPIAISAISPPITVGTTAIVGGTNGYLLYNNAGVLGNIAQTAFASVTGSLVAGNVAILTTTGIADSGVALLTTLPASTVWGNNSTSTGVPAALTVLNLAAGTAGAVPYGFASDPNTGIFGVSADVLGFATGGFKGIELNSVGSGGNYWRIDVNNTPSLTAYGSGANVSGVLAGKGTGGIDIGTNFGSQYIARFFGSGAAGASVNYWSFTGSVTTASLAFTPAGTDSAIGVAWSTKSTGSHIFNTNATARLTMDGLGNVVVGSAAIATNATDGFLYIESGAGPPTGTPTTFTGRVPVYYDSTNDQLYVYRGGWKQPKTPAAAAIVSWQ